MSNDRVSREQETRAVEDVHELGFNPVDDASLLNTENMPPREGYVQRWVRTTINNEDDQSNLYRSINRGWKPRKADSVARGMFVPQVNYQGANVIGINGMILMERPIELHEKQKAYEDQLSNNQMRAVEANMHKVHERGSGLTKPEFTEHKSSVTTGRPAPVAPD